MLSEYIDLILNDDIALQAQLDRIKWCINEAKSLREKDMSEDDILISERLINNTMRDVSMIINGAIDKCLL